MNRHFFVAAVALVTLTFVPLISHAKCVKDAAGFVYCSRQPTGGAAIDEGGTVQCGKGECRKDGGGTVHCSKVIGGGAELDAINIVRCLGGCELGSTEMCVRVERD